MVLSGRRKKASIKVNLIVIRIPDLVLYDMRSVVNLEQLVCKRQQDGLNRAILV